LTIAAFEKSWSVPLNLLSVRLAVSHCGSVAAGDSHDIAMVVQRPSAEFQSRKLILYA
jgi:hypothetical protein